MNPSVHVSVARSSSGPNLCFGANAMSLSGIASSNLFNYGDQNLQNNLQPLPQEFQQLGQDLQSGNLSGAQSSNPIVQAFHQPGQDLQSGNVSAARRDYSNVNGTTRTRRTREFGSTTRFEVAMVNSASWVKRCSRAASRPHRRLTTRSCRIFPIRFKVASRPQRRIHRRAPVASR
jgi:hypothetical protein